MMKEDPQGPQFVITKFQAGEHRPSKRIFFQAVENFKVTRAYSMVGVLSRHTDTGVSIRNKVFSDIAEGALLSWKVDETNSVELVPWRIGYYCMTSLVPGKSKAPSQGKKTALRADSSSSDAIVRAHQ